MFFRQVEKTQPRKYARTPPIIVRIKISAVDGQKNFNHTNSTLSLFVGIVRSRPIGKIKRLKKITHNLSYRLSC